MCPELTKLERAVLYAARIARTKAQDPSSYGAERAAVKELQKHAEKHGCKPQ